MVGKNGDLSYGIIDKVISIYGKAEIGAAKKKYGEEWSFYIAELAAIHFAEPLSRLWYAANMLSLFFVHDDYIRLGYLWAEYKIKIRHEVDSIRGKKSVASARSGAEERARNFDSKRTEIIRCMDVFRNSAKSIANAAALTFKAGFGTSQEANRKLWIRHKKK